MTPEDVLQAIVRALKNSTAFDGGGYVTHELDLDGVDTPIDQPIVSLQVADNPRATEWDSDLADYILDASGARTGRIFRPTWEMAVDAFVDVAAGNDQLDASVLGGDFARALLPYDSQVHSNPFPDGSGGTVEQIESFQVGDGQRRDELAGPGLRRWHHELAVTWYIEITTDDPTVDQVHVPQTVEVVENTNDDEPALVWNY